MRHYLVTSGRSGRIEYISIWGLSGLFLPALALVAKFLIDLDVFILNLLTLLMTLLGVLLTFWLFFTALVRRMHDLGFSGWWLLLCFVLFFYGEQLSGLPLLLIFLGGNGALLFLPGDKGENPFGAPPDLFGGMWEEASSGASAPKTAGRIDFKL